MDNGKRNTMRYEIFVFGAGEVVESSPFKYLVHLGNALKLAETVNIDITITGSSSNCTFIGTTSAKTKTRSSYFY